MLGKAETGTPVLSNPPVAVWACASPTEHKRIPGGGNRSPNLTLSHTSSHNERPRRTHLPTPTTPAPPGQGSREIQDPLNSAATQCPRTASKVGLCASECTSVAAGIQPEPLNGTQGLREPQGAAPQSLGPGAQSSTEPRGQPDLLHAHAPPPTSRVQPRRRDQQPAAQALSGMGPERGQGDKDGPGAWERALFPEAGLRKPGYRCSQPPQPTAPRSF